MDYIKQFIDEHSMKDELDIYGFVMRMRQYRCNMVQVEVGVVIQCLASLLGWLVFLLPCLIAWLVI